MFMLYFNKDSLYRFECIPKRDFLLPRGLCAVSGAGLRTRSVPRSGSVCFKISAYIRIYTHHKLARSGSVFYYNISIYAHVQHHKTESEPLLALAAVLSPFCLLPLYRREMLHSARTDSWWLQYAAYGG